MSTRVHWPPTLVKSKADVREVKFELSENQHDDEPFAVGVPARTVLTKTYDPTEEAAQENFFSDVRKL